MNHFSSNASSKDEPCIKHPQHNPKPSAALLVHSEQATLPAKGHQQFCAAEAAKHAVE